jgi:transcriptional regulator with XRE-family HTH domain
MEKQSQKIVSRNSSEERQLSMNLTSRESLIRRLRRGREVRARFVESHLNKAIAFQAESLREKKGWSQQELAEKLNSSQNAVYRLENPNYGKHTISTLRKVAAAFDVALIARFVPFSELVDWVSGTPRVDPGLDPNTLDVPSFQSEVERGVFEKTSVQECAEDKEVDAALAKKISGEDAIQDRVEGTPNPVMERDSATQGQRKQVAIIALFRHPNAGGFPYYGDPSRRSRQTDRFDESSRMGPTR